MAFGPLVIGGKIAHRRTGGLRLCVYTGGEHFLF